MAEYLGVHQIAYTYEASDKGYGYHEAVKCPEGIAPCGEYGVEYDGEDDGYGTTVARKSSFPNLHDVEGVLTIVFPFVEKDMSESGTYDSGTGYPDEQYTYPSFGCSFALVHAAQYFVAHHETYGKHQAVPSYIYRPSQEVGTHIPNYVIKHNRRDFLFTFVNLQSY